ncbi:hypothetical protein Nepgr_008288 [Nepenthes gracilis]|uniref:Uncharacterized protein n=1 Tax=Nepenthes gracilis TaxID=150966 RepID=A0AAD3XJ42_NEPGR|nr:hypothetical protein Nepgr_008288 [Nepenthes gracilis]
MATTTAHVLLSLSLRRCNCSSTPSPPKSAPSPPSITVIGGRRQCLILLSSATALKAFELPSVADDIPLFGLRKKIEKVEKEAEEIVKAGLETAEKGIEAAEKGIETAEEEIETAVNFDGIAQAAAVAGAEILGVLVATAVVNDILGSEAQKS